MRHRARTRRRGSALRVLLAGAALLLGGCAATDLAEGHRRFNADLERSSNDQILLNVLRASRGLPTYFSTISSNSSGFTGGATGVLTLPFGAGGEGSNLAALTATGQVNAQNSFVTLETEEFTRGINRPVEVAALDYFASQQYPFALLLHLAVKQIVERDLARGSVRYVNDPARPEVFAAFGAKLAALLDQGLAAVPDERGDPLGPALPEEAVARLDLLLTLAQAPPGLRLTRVEAQDGGAATWQLERGGALRLGFPRRLRTAGENAPADAARAASAGGPVSLVPQVLTQPAVEFSLRSAAEIIAHLGALVRAAQRDPEHRPLRVPVGGGREAIPFRLSRTGLLREEDCVARAFLAGQRYCLAQPEPEEVEDWSVGSLAFLNQILALNRSARNLPASNVITILPR